MFEKRLENIASEAAQKFGFYLIDLVIRGHQNNRVIEVFVDGEKDVTAEDCANINRYINRAIEEEELIENYRLDVSSPGLDRPLKYLWQFSRNIKRTFEVSYTDNNNTKKIKGKLLKIVGNDLYFDVNNKEMLINFNDVKKAKVIPVF